MIIELWKLSSNEMEDSPYSGAGHVKGIVLDNKAITLWLMKKPNVSNFSTPNNLSKQVIALLTTKTIDDDESKYRALGLIE